MRLALAVLFGIAIGTGSMQMMHKNISLADIYADTYQKPYIPGCNWDRSKFVCDVHVFNSIDMQRNGRVFINPKRKD